jgi:predicted Zn-ribbon and HTH transcriptional regulator
LSLEFKTSRERIAELIKNRDMSPQEIAKIMEVKEATIIEDLKHIRKSGKYGELLILPARCLKCGYEFDAKIKVPKRCPKCKSTWIEEPRFMIRQ